jgi:hypothetical protein
MNQYTTVENTYPMSFVLFVYYFVELPSAYFGATSPK